MGDQRHAPEEREAASFLVVFDGHPDVVDLERRFKRLLGKELQSGELVDTKILDATAIRSPRPMQESRRRGVGAYLIALGLALLGVIPWAWSTASRVIAAAPGAQIEAHFLGLQFTPSSEFCLVSIVLLAAMLGSVAVLAMTFSARAGHETLERGYLWWYLTRPISGAGLGLLFYMAIAAGFFNMATVQDRPALIIAAAIGGLAGLFTDQVLKKMRTVLGLLPTNDIASYKSDEDEDVVDGSVQRAKG